MQRFNFYHLNTNRVPHLSLFYLLMALYSLPASARSQDASVEKTPVRRKDNTTTQLPIRYALSIPAPQTANRAVQLHVTITAPRLNNDSLEFAIPAWTPGYYQILHYETGIHNVRAQDMQGHALTVVHPSGRAWRVDTSSPSTTPVQPITLSYDVDANDAGLGFFGSSLDMRNQRGYVNGASALMYPVGQTQSPCTVSLEVPAGWQIATPLEPASQKEVQSDTISTLFQARTYDDLIDCPVQLGKFDTIDFQEGGARFQCIIVGRQSGSKEGIRESLRRITHAAIAVFGNAPFTRYDFIYHLGGAGFFGGLEHHNSTVIHLGTGLGSGTSDDFLTTSAHELFHAWNVKRLRPGGLGPFDYTREVHTSSLWFAEGVTDYYAQLLLVRGGLKTREWFWRDMTNRIQQLDRTPARVRVSLHDASTRAWEGGSEGYDGLSYYLKGSLVGLYFDLRLHALTHNQAGLDDVMRHLDTLYGSRNEAYPEDALRAAINAVAGQDLGAEYARLIDNTDEIDWNIALAAAGLQLQRDSVPFLGVRLAEAQNSGQPGAVVEAVEAGHAAARMGVKAADRLLRITANADGHPIEREISADNFHDVIHALPHDAMLTLQIQRGDQILRLTGKAGEVYEHHQLSPLPIGRLTPQEQQDAKELQNQLFASTRPTPLAQTGTGERVSP